MIVCKKEIPGRVQFQSVPQGTLIESPVEYGSFYIVIEAIKDPKEDITYNAIDMDGKLCCFYLDEYVIPHYDAEIKVP